MYYYSAMSLKTVVFIVKFVFKILGKIGISSNTKC